MTWAQAFTVAGLFVALGGAAVAAQSVIITKEHAKTLASAHWDENTALKDSLRSRLSGCRRSWWRALALGLANKRRPWANRRQSECLSSAGWGSAAKALIERQISA